MLDLFYYKKPAISNIHAKDPKFFGQFLFLSDKSEGTNGKPTSVGILLVF